MIKQQQSQQLVHVPTVSPTQASRLKFCRLDVEGPEGEANYVDARYWVTPQRRTNADAPDDYPTYEDDPDDPTFTAVLPDEMGLGETDTGWHALTKTPSHVSVAAPTRYVLVALVAGTWVILPAHLGPIIWERAYRVQCLDSDDCPVGTWDQAIAMPTFARNETPDSC